MMAERSPETFDWTPFLERRAALRAGAGAARDLEQGAWTAKPWGPFDRARMTLFANRGRMLARVLVVASWLAGAAIFWSCSAAPTVGPSLFAGLFLGPPVYYLAVKPCLLLAYFSLAAWDTARHNARWFRAAAPRTWAWLAGRGDGG